MEEMIFVPSEEDKEKIVKLCNKCIDVLAELKSIPEKAFALQHLINSFEETAGVKLSVMKYEEKKQK